MGLELASANMRLVGDEMSLALRGDWKSADVIKDGTPLDVLVSFLTSSFRA